MGTSSESDNHLTAEINEQLTQLLSLSAEAFWPVDSSPDKSHTLLGVVTQRIPSITFQHQITDFDKNTAWQYQFLIKMAELCIHISS